MKIITNTRVTRYISMCIIINFLVVVLIDPQVIQAKSKSYAVDEQIVSVFKEQYESDVLTLAKSYANDFGINEKNLYIGTPFIINDLDEELQDEVYYFPILSEKNEICVIASLMGTTGGWRMSISTEFAEALNGIDFADNQYILCESDENIVAIGINNDIVLEGTENREIQKFENETYSEQIELVEETEDNFQKIDLSTEYDEDSVDMYTKKYSTNTSNTKICSLYNQQNQGNYGNCWAAACATIINYEKGKNYSATTICDKMNVGYNDGATIGVAQLALQEYGVQYNYLNMDSANILPFADVKLNINNKYLVYVSAKSYYNGKQNGHAVTVYGYKDLSNKYVVIWNSGTGTTQTVEYKSSGTTFQYSGHTWRWTFSLSYYA